MKQTILKINNRSVSVPSGSTVMDAAGKLKIDIPTLCYLDGYERFTSCMICVVHETQSDRLIPACSVPVEAGMVIETDSERVRAARRDTLNLLLSEHVGDCEAPCLRGCPAHMNIPLMIRQIRDGNLDKAIITVKKDIALPAVLGRICPAPCENACNRKGIDEPVSICLLKRFVADIDLEKKTPYRPPVKKKTGKRVAIIGAGPAGLSAAYYLAQAGHSCEIFDQNSKPGGMLQYGVPDEVLPKSVLDAEIQQILQTGVTFRSNKTLGKDIQLKKLHKEYDSVILAMGVIDPSIITDSGLEISSRGIAVDRNTFQTSIPGIFAGGNSVSESQRAIRALAHGKTIAFSVNQFLKKDSVTGPFKQFNSTMGKIHENEFNEFLKEAEAYGAVVPKGKKNSGYKESEAVRESRRCLHCDCRKPVSCRLRKYADEYQADQKHYKIGNRNDFRRIIQHDDVIYEPGKCIKCSLCIQITKKAKEDLGLSFVGRGFKVRVTTPFNESLKKGLKKVAKECVESCPTAALSWKDASEE